MTAGGRTIMADAFRCSKSEAECLPMSEMVIGPVILEGRYVRLEPLTAEHTAGLAEIGLDEDLWTWIPSPVRTFEEMSAYVQTALGERTSGSALPFALIDKASGRVIGSTGNGSAAPSTRKRNTCCCAMPLKHLSAFAWS